MDFDYLRIWIKGLQFLFEMIRKQVSYHFKQKM